PAVDPDYYSSVAAERRVCFFGEGPDNALWYEWRSYLSHLVQTRRFGRLARDLSSHIVKHRRIPLLPSIPRMLRERLSGQKCAEQFPTWLQSDFESKLELRSRWSALADSPASEFIHPVRPVAYRSLATSRWDLLFRDFDAGETRMKL